MLMTVYDKAGEPFEVSARIAKKLVVYEGWTFTQPVAPVPVVETVPVEPATPIMKRIKVAAPAPA